MHHFFNKTTAWQEDLMRWIRDPAAFKPGAEMPAYDHLSEAQLSDLATYLRGLQ